MRLSALALTALMPLGLMPLGLRPLPLRAQTDLERPFAKTRAANLARMHAEKLNGGLSLYRAQSCMFRTGGDDCLIERGPSGFTFRFAGGEPGWEQQDPPQPSLETEISVSPDGRTITAVTYNGPLRPSEAGGSAAEAAPGEAPPPGAAVDGSEDLQDF